MPEYAGRGDPRRSMLLLWGRTGTPTRGPKQGLSAAGIVATAMELADTEGLGAVSMRKVGERLGTSAMALYTYVPSKAELIDLMLDTALGELPTGYPLEGGWRAAVEASAADAWAFYQRHPWVLQVSGARAVLGPHELDVYESQMRLYEGIGLTALEMGRAVGAVASHVRGAAQALADVRAAEGVTGVSEDDWWNARSELLAELVGDAWSERYPTITRVEAEHAFDQPDRTDDTTPYLEQDALDTFRFGLDRLLDGIEALIAARQGP